MDEPAPKGHDEGMTETGVSSEAAWFDAAGRPLPGPAGAATAEVAELIDGIEVSRTYATLAGSEPADVDPQDAEDATDPEVEDWIKTATWDLWHDDDGTGQLVLVETLPPLLEALGVPDPTPLPSQRAALADFLTTPAWSAAPAPLRAAVSAFLTSTRPDGQESTGSGGQP